MTDVSVIQRPTALSKILGVYRVSYRNTTAGRSFKQDVLVMENLFYKRTIQQVWCAFNTYATTGACNLFYRRANF